MKITKEINHWEEMKNEVILDDCFEVMNKMIEQNCKINAIITDPPYLYLKHKLDRDFNEEVFFQNCFDLLKNDSFLVFFGRGASFYRWNVICEKIGFKFKEEIIWNKNAHTSPFHKLSRVHETISVLAKGGAKINKIKVNAYKESKNSGNYHIFEQDIKRIMCGLSKIKNFDAFKNLFKFNKKEVHGHGITRSKNSMGRDRVGNVLAKYRNGANLKSIITVKREHFTAKHPTQKPLKLLEYLIKLTTNEKDLVFDPFGGSFSTALSAKNINRDFISCEILKEYCEIGEKRLKQDLLF